MSLLRTLSLPLIISLALTTPTAAQDAAQTARLGAAIAAAGCVMTGPNSDVVISASGLTENQVGVAIEALIASGDVALADGSLTLLTGTCADGPNVATSQMFVAAQWANALTASDAAAFLEREFGTVGCAITSETSDAFEENLARNVAIFNGVELPGPIVGLEDAGIGDYLRAVDDMAKRGRDFLVDNGRIDESEPGVFRLIDCTPAAP